MKSSNELTAAAKLLGYRVGRLNRFLAESDSVPSIILRNEARLIKDAYDEVNRLIGGDDVEDRATR